MEKKTSNPLPLKDVKIRDGFWSRYQDLVREQVLPYQWEALNDRIPGAEPSHAMHNLRVAAGLETGEYEGLVFQDSDVGKWLEAVGYSLQTKADPKLEALLDEVASVLEKAQGEDGYLNSYYLVKEPGNRWTNLWECHELYCAGHLIEGAIACWQATGKRKLLDIVRRYADYIDKTFGPNKGQIRGYDGHEEIELALVKLYRATGEKKYLRLANFFVEERGRQPYFFDTEWEKRGKTGYWAKGPVPAPGLNPAYNQAHAPVREQTSVEGHSVRAVYLLTAMADLALENKDDTLLEACRTLWDNMTLRRMYVTGGIGSTAHGEAFTMDYDLPNDTIYAETCASIGLIFFAQRMLRLQPKGEYADIMERALYNTVLAGIAQDGKRFFYVNPLEVWPEAGLKNPSRRHVLTQRPPWFGCSCCPPNVARLLASLGDYAYTQGGDTVYCHLYMGGRVQLDVAGGPVLLTTMSELPWNGAVGMKITTAQPRQFTLALRIPAWCANPKLRINGEEQMLLGLVRDGYAYVRRIWKEGDTLELDLPMRPVRVRATPAIRADIGKVAVQCGPIVYCLEEEDNGDELHEVVLPAGNALKLEYDEELLGGCNVVCADGLRPNAAAWGEEPYLADVPNTYYQTKLLFIPYYLWANRDPGEMLVWVREG